MKQFLGQVNSAEKDGLIILTPANKGICYRIYRGEWTVEEDYLLICKVQENGKKWSEYGQEMHRTEHTVKNRFNSLIIRQKRMTPHVHKEEKLIELVKKHLKNCESSYEIGN
jgi:hypothetical protein